MPDIWLYQGAPNPSDIKLGDPTQLRIMGSGDTSFPVSAFAASALEVFIGDARAVPAVTRLMAWGGPGAALEDGFLAGISLPVSAVAAAGLEVFIGTGTIAFDVSAIDATGTTGAAGITGTGSVTFDVSALAATALEVFIGTESATLPVSALAATGLEVFTGSADVALPVSALASTGLEIFTGSASIAPPVSAVDASALEVFTGTASLTFPVSAIDATGGTFTGIAGLGGVTFPVSSIDGIGLVEVVEVEDQGAFAGEWIPVDRLIEQLRRRRARIPIVGRGDVTFKASQMNGTGTVTERLALTDEDLVGVTDTSLLELV